MDNLLDNELLVRDHLWKLDNLLASLFSFLFFAIQSLGKIGLIVWIMGSYMCQKTGDRCSVLFFFYY